MSNDALQEAYRLIRAGQQQQAVRILVPIVRDEPLNADAWWLLANAVENNDQKVRALRTVLKLRPNDAAAQRMIDRLTPPAASPLVEEARPDDFDFRDDDAFSDDPFGETPQRVRVRRGRGSSPLTIILALIGLLTVVSCAACLLVTVFSGTAISKVFSEIVLTVTFEPRFGTLAHLAAATPVAATPVPQLLPGDLQKRGSISVGDTKQASLDSFQDDSWTFSADANEHVIIELYANTTALDPHLYLYDPSGLQIADNDDIDGANNRNSRLDLTLSKAGLYTIRVSKFSDGGNYALSLREG